MKIVSCRRGICAHVRRAKAGKKTWLLVDNIENGEKKTGGGQSPKSDKHTKAMQVGKT